MKYGILAGVGAVLAGGVAFAKGKGGHCGRGRGGFSIEQRKKFVTAKIDDVLGELKVTDAQKTRIYASRDKVFAAFEASHPAGERKGKLKQIAEMFERDRLDMREVEALRNEHRDKRLKVEDAVAEALVEVHATLTPAQRSGLVKHLKEIRGGWRHGGDED